MQLKFGPELRTNLEMRLDENVDNFRSLSRPGNGVSCSGLSKKRETTRSSCFSREESCDSQWTRGMVPRRGDRHPYSNIGGLGRSN
ncbi:hypothetical protein ES703_82548 [subsurface metagenome]